LTRIFIVDDSAFARRLLRSVLDPAADLLVVGEAGTGREALDALGREPVDIVTLDVHLPDMSGLDVLRAIRRRFPSVSVLMLSALTQEGARTTVEALTIGAVDFIDKTQFGSFDVQSLGDQLLAKLRAIAVDRAADGGAFSRPPRPEAPASSALLDACQLCVIGASTGGPSMVQRILQSLSAPPPFPLVVAQHMPPRFTREFARRLDGVCRCEVREAAQGEPLRRGTAYIAPGGMHLRVARDETVQLIDATSDTASPSVDELFLSASALPLRCVGVLLTGMGRDGARGLAAIRERGGITIAQSAASCVVYGMPRAAVELQAVQYLLSIEQISEIFRGACRP
jgi:two-component system chemotaxis response regulator CheB